jgi:UPF0716 protein FxsA
MWLFLAFLLVPLIEIGLFIQVGGIIGLWPTLAVVVLTALAGTMMVRSQGVRAMENLRRSFAGQADPGEALAHGAMILVSGALLMTPGFFTDAVGFALLVPQVRMAVFRWLRQRMQVVRFDTSMTSAQPRRPSQPDVIDGEYTEVPPEKPANHPGSGWTRH